MSTNTLQAYNEIVILFAGDSGDGIQFTGNQFTETVEIFGNDISTFPDYPPDIRAPQGTLAGVSGFQMKFGNREVFTPGDQVDVLVAMNAAALKISLPRLKTGGIIIANTGGFDRKNLKNAKYSDGENPLTDHSLDEYKLYAIDVSMMTREALKDTTLNLKEIDRCKNMFVLGFLYWMFNKKPDYTSAMIEKKFGKAPEIAAANLVALKTGFHYGDTSETFTTRFQVEPARLPAGRYRNINGNQAVALALVAAAERNQLPLFYASYPITPASEILQDLSQYKNYGVKTFQAEDEIAAMCAVIGAAFGGSLSATATSGPGMALKAEAIGLGVMLELPMVIVNVQRGGPSTGLPTKTEQSDLLQALHGRNGEAPVPVLAVASPKDCFSTVYAASKIAVEHMTPVIVLSDGYIANGSEPWRFPVEEDLQRFFIRKPQGGITEPFQSYRRDDRLVREWAWPGLKGYEHRLGGLEKEVDTGRVSYDPENHQKMVRLRAEKIRKITDYIPEQTIQSGEEGAELLLLGWGSTHGSLEIATRQLLEQGRSVAHIQIRHLYPFPKNLGYLLGGFDKILIPELNDGQLIRLIREEYHLNAAGMSKMKGLPFTASEIEEEALKLLS